MKIYRTISLKLNLLKHSVTWPLGQETDMMVKYMAE